MTSTTSVGSGWKRTSLGTTVPTACERDESLLPVVVGADWLVVVADFGVPEDVDWAFWADGVELGEEAVGEAAAGADEFELV